jgi:tetratricopeptide (TPR) repeat protein
VWDAITGTELLMIGDYEDPIWSTVFTPDSKTIAVAGPGVTLLESAVPPGGYGPRKAAEAARIAVDELYQKHGFYREVIEKLQVDTTFDEPIRKLALQIANSRKSEDAKKLVDELYKEHGSYHEVIEKLQADKTLDEPIRKLAIQIADSRKKQDVEKLMREIGEEMTEMVSLPGGDPNVYRAALEKVEKANRMDPNNPDILVALGMAQHLAGKYEDAIKTLTKAAGLEPNMPDILGPLGEAQYDAGKYEDAVKTLTKVLEISRRVLGEQDWSTLYSMNQLAWMQATSPAAEFRNGAEAVKNATRVCELTEWKKAQYVDTLAAAYAEVGDFESAIKWQKEAINLLTKKEPAEWPGQFDDRLKLYESGKPCRESP